MNRKFYFSSSAAVLILALAAWKCTSEPQDPPPHEITETHSHHEHLHYISLSEEQMESVDFEIEEAGAGDIDLELQTRGKVLLHPDKVAHVLPKISGVAFEARKNIGDKSRKGEILAILESKEIAEIKAEYLSAKEKEALALAKFESERRLYSRHISPEIDFLTAKAELEEAKILFALASQKLQALGLTEDDLCCLEDSSPYELRMYPIRSPIDGTVISRHICQGEYIEDTEHIYEIADLDHLWVEFGIFPKDLPQIKEGQHASITCPITQMCDNAEIIYLSPILEEESILSKAIASLENPEGRWKPGSYVAANIAVGTLKAPVVIPRSAVQNLEGTPVVFVKIPGGFEIRTVELGAGDKAHVAIAEGLAPGEPIATAHTFLLKAEHGKNEVEHDH